MAWTDLTLAGSILDGIDRSYFGHLRDATISAGEETDESRRLVAARDKLRLLLQGPKYLGPFAATYGLASFFDDLAAEASLQNDIQSALAYCYAWFRYTHASQSPNDIDEVRAERMEMLLKEVLLALSQSVPVTLGVTSEAPSQPVVTAVSLVMDTSGRDSFSASDGDV